MRVLHVLNSLNPSGAEVMLEIANNYWNDNGIYSDILATGEFVGDYKCNLENAGMTVYHIPLNPKYKFLLHFYKFLRLHYYDVIHIHSEGASIFAASVARIQKGQTIVRTVHHIWPRKRLLPFLKRMIYRFISNKLLRVIPVSNSISGQENERKCFNAKNMLIPNWYDDEKFLPISDDEKEKLRKVYDLSNKSIVITSLGGNWPYKNYWMIIEALSKLPPSTKMIYFQIGPEGDGNPLQELAKKLGNKDKMYFWGKVDNVIPLLQISDYYIMPSAAEGFGNAAIEAMSVGLKPILSNVKALSDFKYYYSESEIIWISPTVRDIEDVLRNIERNSSTKSMNYEFRKKMHIKTKKHFGLNVGAGKYIDLYSQLNMK